MYYETHWSRRRQSQKHPFYIVQAHMRIWLEFHSRFMSKFFVSGWFFQPMGSLPFPSQLQNYSRQNTTERTLHLGIWLPWICRSSPILSLLVAIDHSETNSLHEEDDDSHVSESSSTTTLLNDSSCIQFHHPSKEIDGKDNFWYSNDLFSVNGLMISRRISSQTLSTERIECHCLLSIPLKSNHWIRFVDVIPSIPYLTFIHLVELLKPTAEISFSTSSSSALRRIAPLRIEIISVLRSSQFALVVKNENQIRSSWHYSQSHLILQKI